MKFKDFSVPMLMLHLVAFPGLTLASAVLFAFDLKCFWSWFIVPVFQVREIGMSAAYGLTFFSGLIFSGLAFSNLEIKNSLKKEFKHEENSIIKVFYEKIFLIVSGYAFVLLVGYIYHLVLM